MKPRRRVHKPLLGFGPAGWILLAVFLAILIPALMGVDVQYETQKLILYIFGVDAMMLATTCIFALWSPLFGVSISFIPACTGLIAFAIAPFRIPLTARLVWFVACSFCFLAVLMFNAYIIPRVFPHLSPWPVFWRLHAPDILGYTLVALFAWWLTQSWIVVTGWGIGFLINIAWNAMAATNNYINIFFYPLFTFKYYSICPAWILFHLLTSGSLLLWAILERRKPIHESLCPSCDYDLVGLSPSSPCPECGKTPSADNDPLPPGATGGSPASADAQAAAAHPDGVNHDPKP